MQNCEVNGTLNVGLALLVYEGLILKVLALAWQLNFGRKPTVHQALPRLVGEQESHFFKGGTSLKTLKKNHEFDVPSGNLT